MLYRALATINPGATRNLHETLVKGMEMESLGFRAQEITTLWTTFADMKVKDKHAIDLLCEETRRLRLDHTFNQHMVVAIGKSITTMKIDDARVIYQLVHWVRENGESMNAQRLLEVCEFLSGANINDEKAWKRLGVRAQKRGIDLSLADARKLRHCFYKVRRSNQRVAGILDLFVNCKEDEAKYGAF